MAPGNRATVTRNIRSLYVARFVTGITSFLLVPILLAGLGLGDFGLFVLSTAILGYFGLLELGVGSSLTKYVSALKDENAKEELEKLVGSATSFAIGSGVLAAVLLLGAAATSGVLFRGDADSASKARAFLILLLPRALVGPVCAIPGAILRGKERYDFTSLSEMTLQVATLVGIFLLLALGHGLFEVGLFFTAIAPLGALLNAILLGRLIPGVRLRLTLHPYRQAPAFFRFGIANTAVAITFVLMYQADFLITGTLLTTAAVGLYAVLMKLNQLYRDLDWLAVQAIIPYASRLSSANDEARMRTLLAEGSRLLGALEFTVLAALVVFAPAFLQVWVGPQFTSWAWLCQLSLIIFFLAPAISVASNMMIGQGKMRQILKLSAATGIVNVTASFVLTLVRGDVSGVILGTVIAWVALYPAWFRVMVREFKISLRTLLRPVLPSYASASVAAMVSLLFLQLPLPLTVLTVVGGLALSVAVALAAYGTCFLTRDERRLIVSEILGARLARRLL